MKKFLFITMVMLLSIASITYANTPCCNSKITCSKCAKGCGPNCKDYCSKACKDSGEYKTKCKL